MLGLRLGIGLPTLAKHLTHSFEGSFVDLAINLDDVDGPASTVVECCDLLDSTIMPIQLVVMAKPSMNALLLSAFYTLGQKWLTLSLLSSH